ncbi:hypothetical protein ACFYR1_52525 [Streptomyces canus]|uniref:hypothetical protein n=1 Tax=Streptomyces canus TaxID=58343 RepID=UPI0036A5B021
MQFVVHGKQPSGEHGPGGRGVLTGARLLGAGAHHVALDDGQFAECDDTVSAPP